MALQGFCTTDFLFACLVIAALLVAKNSIIDCHGIVIQKADSRWHDSDKACKVDTCGLTLVAPLTQAERSLEPPFQEEVCAFCHIMYFAATTMRMNLFSKRQALQPVSIHNFN